MIFHNCIFTIFFYNSAYSSELIAFLLGTLLRRSRRGEGGGGVSMRARRRGGGDADRGVSGEATRELPSVDISAQRVAAMGRAG